MRHTLITAATPSVTTSPLELKQKLRLASALFYLAENGHNSETVAQKINVAIIPAIKYMPFGICLLVSPSFIFRPRLGDCFPSLLHLQGVELSWLILLPLRFVDEEAPVFMPCWILNAFAFIVL